MKIGAIPAGDQVLKERLYHFLALMDPWGKESMPGFCIRIWKKPPRRSMVGDSPARGGLALEGKRFMDKLLELAARPVHSAP